MRDTKITVIAHAGEEVTVLPEQIPNDGIVEAVACQDFANTKEALLSGFWYVFGKINHVQLSYWSRNHIS